MRNQALPPTLAAWLAAGNYPACEDLRPLRLLPLLLVLTLLPCARLSSLRAENATLRRE